MTTSPTLTTNYLPQADPRQQDAFPHSPIASAEEMEEKDNVNQIRRFASVSEQCLFSATYFELAATIPRSPRGRIITSDIFVSGSSRMKYAGKPVSATAT